MNDGEGGMKKVGVTGMNDKRQITVVLSITKAGHYLITTTTDLYKENTQ